MTACRELIERLEKATGPNVYLDCDIHAALVAQIPKGYTRGSASGAYLMAHGKGGRTWSEKVPAYTASIDAALSLVEMMMPSTHYVAGFGPDGFCAFIDTRGPSFKGNAPSLPLAILLALLCALEAQSKDKEEGE